MMQFIAGDGLRTLLIRLILLLVAAGGIPSSAFGAEPPAEAGNAEETATTEEDLAITGLRFEAGMAALQAAWDEKARRGHRRLVKDSTAA